MRVAIRGFGDGRKIFEELVEMDAIDLTDLAEQHTEKLRAYERHMVELEFVDEPDEGQRFFRFGTDPGMMVRPIAIALWEEK